MKFITIITYMSNKNKFAFANHNHPHTKEETAQIIENAAKAYEAYMDALGYDWRNDPNSSNTPHRVAKAFVEDFAWGCYSNPPKVTALHSYTVPPVVFDHTGVGVPYVTTLPVVVPEPGK